VKTNPRQMIGSVIIISKNSRCASPKVLISIIVEYDSPVYAIRKVMMKVSAAAKLQT